MRHHWRLRITWLVGCLALLNLQITSQTQSGTNPTPAKQASARTLLRQAQALAFKISDKFQQDALLNAIGAAQVRAGDFDGAIESANRAYLHGGSITEAIEEYLADLNDLTVARSLGAKIKDGNPSFFFSGIAKTYARRSRIDEALQVAQQIQFPEARGLTLQDIAQFQASRGDEAGARKTFAMARAATKEEGLINADDLEMIIIGAKAGKDDDAKVRATIESWEPEKKLAIMIGVTEKLRQGQKIPAAKAWLDDLLREMPNDPKFDLFRYFVMPIQVRLGDKDKAMATAETFSGELSVNAYTAVAVTCAEVKDTACVDAALEKMESSAKSDSSNRMISDYVLKHMILNVTAALIDNDQFEAASRWLAKVEPRSDDVGTTKTLSQWQRVVILSKTGKFPAARSLALRIRPDSIIETKRGEAMRALAYLQTKSEGPDRVKAWAMTIPNGADRAYLLVGIAQRLLGMEALKMPYSAIMIH